jgi:hypothetical protein
MAQLTRQGFIKRASVGAATIGALAVAPGLAAAHVSSKPKGTIHPAIKGHQPLAAYVKDVSKGEIAVMFDTREVIVHDPALVHLLVKAAR